MALELSSPLLQTPPFSYFNEIYKDGILKGVEDKYVLKEYMAIEYMAMEYTAEEITLTSQFKNN
eukprot:3405267-Ditylum_brightwellii.AAC.1